MEEGRKIERIVYSPIVGDIFHYGHLKLLKFANSQGDYHICGVLTDEAVKVARKEPISNFNERYEVVSNIKFIDEVITQEYLDPTENLKKIHERFKNAKLILVYGSGWREVPGADYIKEINGEVRKPPREFRISELKIVNRVLENYKGEFKNFEELINYFKLKDFVYYDSNNIKTAKISTTKTNLLRTINPLLNSQDNERSIFFSIKDWEEKREEILEKIKKEFSDGLIFVRGFSSNEDVLKPAIEGFDNIELNLDAGNKMVIESAIEKIISSYVEKFAINLLDTFIIQKQDGKIEFNGSVFTSTQEDKHRFYVVNYNDQKACLENQVIYTKDSNDGNFKFSKLIKTVEEIENLIPNVSLQIDFAIDENQETTILQINPIARKFVHAWGGTTSVQSLECHTLRYIKYPQIGNTIAGNIFCEIKNRHHTVYFENKDILRWNKEGYKLLDEKNQDKIINENLNQIKDFYEFLGKYENEDYSRKTNEELLMIYERLMNLVMENGSFFPYSREDLTKPIKEKIVSLLGKGHKKQEIFQILTTPTEEDIFLKEKKDKLLLIEQGLTNKENVFNYARKNPWLFINTYSEKEIFDYIVDELSKTDPITLEKEIQDRLDENMLIKKQQDEYFRKINSDLLKNLCLFLQKIAVIRLENKKIWAGYEFLFFNLFKEIAKRIGLSMEDYLYSYRIEETELFLKEDKKLSKEIVKKRHDYFNLEISPAYVELSYDLRYSNELDQIPAKSGLLKGEVGNLGKVVGRALVVTDDSIKSIMKTKKEMTPDDIYITTMTHPAMVSILHDVKGIVTDEGGIASHASIISREFNIPCLVGTKVATKLFKTGDIIELNPYNNYVKKLSKNEVEEFKAKQIYKPISYLKDEEIENIIIYPPELIPYTVNFEDVTEKETSVIGGKGLNLIKCLSYSNIPKGFCLTRRIYDEILEAFFKENDKFTINIKNLKESQKNLEKLREFIQNYEFNDVLKKELFQKFRNLDSSHVAVRSSASCEDSTKVSFAGQFKTVLAVNEEKLLDSIKECIASSFTENVISYMGKAGINFKDFYMAIVIQKFIESEKAGVLFSKNPSDGLKEGFLIDANFGVGESVVSGRVRPDRYFLGKDRIESYIPDEKEVYSYNNGELSITKKSDKVLNDNEIEQLSILGKSLKELYNQEIEFEWCFFNNKLHLLQARPITT